jgi:carbonic anhydrase
MDDKQVTRRDWLKVLSAGTAGGLLGGMTAPPRAQATTAADLTDLVPLQSESPLVVGQKLMAGNSRHVNSTPIPHDLFSDEALEAHFGFPLASTQRPSAMVLSCADSRVVPELIFDQPRASLFVCRVAGNYATDEAIGSFEFCVRFLKAPAPNPDHSRVLVVLGHSGCGAVDSTISVLRGTFGGDIRNTKIGAIVGGLAADVQAAFLQNPGVTNPLELLRLATEEVARANARRLAALPSLAPLVQSGALLIAAAVYDIETGVVRTV